MTDFYSGAWRRSVAMLALALPSLAGAQCSRDIHVPVSAIGASVVINGASVSGIYPDLLRSMGAKVGCNFIFSPVPRARLEAMFEAGKADMLIPASSTLRRDQHGLFIPLMGNRPLLISLQGARAPINSMQELIERRELRVALVRGYDYGASYQALAKELSSQGRLFYEVDALSVARLMQSGFIDATIMGPTILAGVAQNDARVYGLADRLRMEALPELPWGMSGVYLSRKSLTPDDQATLRELLEKAGRSGVLMEGFQRHHRQELLTLSIRPR
ncbi:MULTISPECIES: ABC transporter substrate-binding protein [unclassified Janthinobacterium]|uniref:substrate-binding periplasmic protein n=1 Tax=unclassified Janthinobacterium TaxID=2610881 RepID=UPI000892348A|nr:MULTISPECIES: transporter substrate-binding domain-containing protein [unclassified Janthinobacterium]SDA81279.1 polar amino acid transport system substrate-binding protein [Janthinobacterium sp. 551a]SFB65374.1 polar amino acid transport system substrate-binding protein [Janthinobacterium sp. 344]